MHLRRRLTFIKCHICKAAHLKLADFLASGFQSDHMTNAYSIVQRALLAMQFSWTHNFIVGVLNVISVIRARDLRLPQQATMEGIYVQVTHLYNAICNTEELETDKNRSNAFDWNYCSCSCLERRTTTPRTSRLHLPCEFLAVI